MPPTRLSRRESIVEVLQPGPSTTGPSSTTRTSKNRAPKKPLVLHPDVIEISDSDDDPFTPPAPPVKRKSSRELQLEREVKKLKQENELHKNKANSLRAEITSVQDKLTHLLATSSSASSSKDHMPISDVEDSVTCEICTMKMWTPYILECGHTYCQSCLQDWFSTTLAQHMAAHPNYNINQHQHPYGADMYAAYPGFAQHHYMHLLGAATPQPHYTCPICRKQVRNPPVEDFNLKKIVRAVASVQGESSPRKGEAGSSRRKGKAKGKAPAQREDPWSGFFRRT
ncbi:uncharacterized protein C8R40DRAFT_1170711 [Lentinula edodes]|uniref:uncharacterized protein n=1 Tax=Lentinula edodes TaxID=5353 RepID=UPI001E8D4E10|nr:uncharacterized protein C8R40DRAFT_1170711 [Lentinula edodes]KAH7875081.1 hypothetical protein C8R40DRAFT_1170711 [Lentinula edodes]